MIGRTGDSCLHAPLPLHFLLDASHYSYSRLNAPYSPGLVRSKWSNFVDVKRPQLRRRQNRVQRKSDLDLDRRDVQRRHYLPPKSIISCQWCFRAPADFYCATASEYHKFTTAHQQPPGESPAKYVTKAARIDILNKLRGRICNLQGTLPIALVLTTRSFLSHPTTHGATLSWT